MSAATIEEAIYARATTGPTLNPIIGTRCYPVTFPEGGTYPALAVQRISSPREHAMGTDPGVAHSRFQVTAADKTRTGAQTLAAAVRADFARWRGTVGSVVVQDTFVETQADLPFDIDVQLHLVPVDLLVHHGEV